MYSRSCIAFPFGVSTMGRDQVIHLLLWSFPFGGNCSTNCQRGYIHVILHFDSHQIRAFCGAGRLQVLITVTLALWHLELFFL